MGEKIQVDFRHFVKLSKSNVISWDSLSTLLHEMASNFALSKELNKVLLEELKASETKIHELLSNEKNGSIEDNQRNELTEPHIESAQNIPLNPENRKKDNVENDDTESESENGHNQNETVKCETIAEKESEIEVVEEDAISKKDYECNICWKRFSSKSKFELHDNNHENEKPQECKTCGQILSLSCILNEHKNVKTIEVYDKSESNTELSPKELENDSLTTNELLLLKVEDLAEESDLIEPFPSMHSLTNNAQNEFKCEKCHKTFKKEISLKMHSVYHRKKKSHVCLTCSKAFKSNSKLKDHQIIHSGKKPYECNTCKKTFYRSAHLRIHERYHTGEKPYECKTCKKSFFSSSHLKTHVKIHTGERNFECKICKKTFIAAQSMRDHHRIHTGEKPFECKTCKKSFRQLSHLNLHLRTHTEEKPYACKYCAKGFAQSSNHKKHLMKCSKILSVQEFKSVARA